MMCLIFNCTESNDSVGLPKLSQFIIDSDNDGKRKIWFGMVIENEEGIFFPENS